MGRVAGMGVRVMARVLRGEGCSASAALLGYEDLLPRFNVRSPVIFSRAGASAVAPASWMLLPGRGARCWWVGAATGVCSVWRGM